MFSLEFLVFLLKDWALKGPERGSGRREPQGGALPSRRAWGNGQRAPR